MYVQPLLDPEQVKFLELKSLKQEIKVPFLRMCACMRTELSVGEEAKEDEQKRPILHTAAEGSCQRAVRCPTPADGHVRANEGRVGGAGAATGPDTVICTGALGCHCWCTVRLRIHQLSRDSS